MYQALYVSLTTFVSLEVFMKTLGCFIAKTDLLHWFSAQPEISNNSFYM